MARVLTIANGIVTLGCEGGVLKEVREEDLNFVPVVGDEVEVFSSESKTIISKKEPTPTQVRDNTHGDGNINIRIDNGSHNTAPETNYSAMESGKVVKKSTYVILALLLGGIGIHEFYAGKTGMGILYILFCWTGIPLIVAIIQAIIALTKPSDANGNIVMG